MFDGTEDIKVGESTDDGEKDDCFYGGVRRVKRKRAEKSTHLGELRMAAAANNNCRTTLITFSERPRTTPGRPHGANSAAAQTISRPMKAALGTAS